MFAYREFTKINHNKKRLHQKLLTCLCNYVDNCSTVSKGQYPEMKKRQYTDMNLQELELNGRFHVLRNSMNNSFLSLQRKYTKFVSPLDVSIVPPKYHWHFYLAKKRTLFFTEKLKNQTAFNSFTCSPATDLTVFAPCDVFLMLLSSVATESCWFTNECIWKTT